MTWSWWLLDPDVMPCMWFCDGVMLWCYDAGMWCWDVILVILGHCDVMLWSCYAEILWRCVAIMLYRSKHYDTLMFWWYDDVMLWVRDVRRLCVFPSLSHSFFTLLLCLIRFAKDLVYVFMYVSCECVSMFMGARMCVFVCVRTLWHVSVFLKHGMIWKEQ